MEKIEIMSKASLTWIFPSFRQIFWSFRTLGFHNRVEISHLIRTKGPSDLWNRRASLLLLRPSVGEDFGWRRMDGTGTAEHGRTFDGQALLERSRAGDDRSSDSLSLRRFTFLLMVRPFASLYPPSTSLRKRSDSPVSLPFSD